MPHDIPAAHGLPGPPVAVLALLAAVAEQHRQAEPNAARHVAVAPHRPWLGAWQRVLRTRSGQHPCLLHGSQDSARTVRPWISCSKDVTSLYAGAEKPHTRGAFNVLPEQECTSAVGHVGGGF